MNHRMIDMALQQMEFRCRTDGRPYTERVVLTVEEGGYVGFFSELTFNSDGSLKSLEAWE
jgi:hypothetical protein